MNVRLVNYTLNNGLYHYHDKQVITENKSVMLGSHLQMLSEYFLPEPPAATTFIRGVEDVRLFEHDGGICFLGTKMTAAGVLTVCWGKYGMDGLTDLVEMTNIKGCEKNWSVVPNGESKITVVYEWGPLTLGEFDGTTLNRKEIGGLPKLFNLARGSTNGFLYKDEYWFVVQYQTESRVYFHSLIVLDRAMKMVKYTLPFKLSKKPVEFCCGLVVEDNRILLGYSENDQTTTVTVYHPDVFDFIEK
jgi:hypothetical protein